MMQCPSCSAPLVSGEARCSACRALVNPPVQGGSALAPRPVTPESIEGLSGSVLPGPEPEAPSSPPRGADEAWRLEVLERVRKRRQVRAHALPLFADTQTPDAEREESPSEPALGASAVFGESPRASVADRDLSDLSLKLENPDQRATGFAADLSTSLDAALSIGPADDLVLDLPLRPTETGRGNDSRSHERPSQSLVERPRPTLVSGPAAPRSLVADLPLVAPTRREPAPAEAPTRVITAPVSSRAASMNDRLQAAFIDVGMWSAMSVTAFYFASRIARTSIVGLGPAWQGLALFAVVLAAAYILFFGGLSGATPGKIACGIEVKRYDGSPLGPLASLGRGFLGIVGVAFLGIGIWPAFWDRDRRTLHDRATDSRVTTV